ncbi:hypothetical protein SLEP1_g4729 [Rubroshorea leprosula]|uniref:Uncharacterized protein n=1 Tax=Rubroshorea leprosula TaxID=152421 RepID=A0AAV5HTY8_9ROSI|nr:hypothetical protein SLEP1_g4729 [Rubroshorea leprosula]
MRPALHRALHPWPLRACTLRLTASFALHQLLRSAPDPLAACCAEPTLLARLHSVPAS